jgi:hypothetical protein
MVNFREAERTAVADIEWSTAERPRGRQWWILLF